MIVFSFFLSSCSSQPSESAIQTTIAQTAQDRELRKQDAINQFIAMFDENDLNNGAWKIIEDAWKANIEDEELAALNHFCNAIFWLDVGDREEAQFEMRRISPDYSGVFSDRISELGVEIFGNKEVWEQQHKVAIGIEQRENNEDKLFMVSVYKYVDERFKYYDDLEGSYSGDKYTETVFQEAAVKFNITSEEVEDIWNDLEIISLINSESQ